jgi:hypothetical protein
MGLHSPHGLVLAAAIRTMAAALAFSFQCAEPMARTVGEGIFDYILVRGGITYTYVLERLLRRPMGQYDCSCISQRRAASKPPKQSSRNIVNTLSGSSGTYQPPAMLAARRYPLKSDA